ncbi:MAG: methyltransferase domain-containing protein [Nitrospirae bacterium]|jgi:DNA modification methylase|nr:methyltransferase domain-containing protein [Nitrospirota bacterium]
MVEKCIKVTNEIKCPICNISTSTLNEHMKFCHNKKEFELAIIADKNKGLSDIEIGEKYCITYNQLEKIIRRATGLSISILKNQKEIKSLSPNDFKEETTTVWSFKSRGNWATHSGEYRGNWSPYIPRNVILRYSEPGDIVLDYFVGAGTTAVEAKLLGRRCIAHDINEKAIELAKKNVDFEVPKNKLLPEKIYEPDLSVMDARDLSYLKSDSIDLICAHPPYANIIHYTEFKEGDLSYLDTEHFLTEMEKVAMESYRVLKPGRKCVILIGDMRRHKHVVPLGFNLINVFLNAGFKLKELVIKRQHNCKTTGFWYANSIKFNFLLLAHEYLPIFEKPLFKPNMIKEQTATYGLVEPILAIPHLKKDLKEMETTTVWIFPEDKFENLLNKNVIERYRDRDHYRIINLSSCKNDLTENTFSNLNKKFNLLFIKSPCLNNENITHPYINIYLEKLKEIVYNASHYIKENGYCVIQTRDVRINDYLEPIAKYIYDSIKLHGFSLKEIIVTATENHKDKYSEKSQNLQIVHQYLLVYKKLNK